MEEESPSPGATGGSSGYTEVTEVTDGFHPEQKEEAQSRHFHRLQKLKTHHDMCENRYEKAHTKRLNDERERTLLLHGRLNTTKEHECSSDSETTFILDLTPVDLSLVYEDTSVPELRRTDSVILSRQMLGYQPDEPRAEFSIEEYVPQSQSETDSDSETNVKQQKIKKSKLEKASCGSQGGHDSVTVRTLKKKDSGHTDGSSTEFSEEEYVPPSQSETDSDSETNVKQQKIKKRKVKRASSSSQVANENVTVMTLKKKDSGHRLYNKKFYCVFCSKPFSKMARHLESKHKDKPEVARAIAFPKGSKERRIQLSLLRNRGNRAHNNQVLKEGKGMVIPRQQSIFPVKATEYLHCVNCEAYLKRRTLWRHMQRCHLHKKVKGLKPGRTRVQALCTYAQPVPDSVSAQFWKIMTNMHEDEVSDVIRKEKSILKFGEHLFNKHGHDVTKHDYIRQKMRETGRVVLQAKKNGKLKMVSDFFVPANFPHVIEAVKNVAGFNEETNTYKTPSLALKLGHNLKKIADIVECEAMISGDEDAIRNVQMFKQLCDTRWNECVSSQALRTLSEAKWNAPQLLPFAEDVKKMHEYLNTQREEYQAKLEEEPNKKHWAELAKTTLCEVIVFNRRRAGEVSKMPLNAFTLRDISLTNPDVELALSDLEKKLCKHFQRVEIKGKRGRKVPILLTPEMLTSMELLVKTRHNCDVSDDNRFMFGRPEALSHFRGSDVIRQFAQSCGANHPEALSSTKLRKHMATMSKVLNLKDNEMDDLADFLGHDIRVHRQYYRLPEGTLQLAKISKVLMALERGQLSQFKGRNLDEININPKEKIAVDSDASDTGDEADKTVEDASPSSSQSSSQSSANTCKEACMEQREECCFAEANTLTADRSGVKRKSTEVGENNDQHPAKGISDEKMPLVGEVSGQLHTTKAHNVCEQVLVTLCLARPGGPVDTHSQETFCFVQDLALDMAHFLLDSVAPQEALLLDDHQIPLKECERLDQSLALALKHLSLRPHRTVAGVDRQMGNQTLTDTRTHSGKDSHCTETHKETCMDVSTPLDSCTAVSQCQQLSRLLHLAASHGLKTVAAFLLQQPGAREALRRPSAQGLTAACLAESRGHQQLVELFTQYEASSDVQGEPKEELHFHPEGRVFQRHTSLGTYTLTSPGLHQREVGAETQSSEDGCLQEELQELRRHIHLHRDRKGNSDFSGPIVPTPDLGRPACGLQLCSNGQQESRQDAGLSVVTIETCSTTTKEQGSPPSLKERAQGEDSAVVTHTSGTSGSVCQSQEAPGEQKGTAAANSRSRRNKKRTRKTPRQATESPGSSGSTPEAGRGSARKPTKTTGSRTETEGPALASVIGDEGATKTQCSPRTEETPLPIKRVSAPGGDGKCSARKAVALPATTIVEKQEGEKWEVDLLICERVVETEAVTQTEQGDAESLPAQEAPVNFDLESAAEKTVTMGQEQSQEPQESQSDTEEPSQLDTMNNSPQSVRRTGSKSPDTERKPRRVLWRDGGWIGSRMGSPPHEPETVAKTVWYHGENPDQGANEDWNREVNSQSVWYDSDTADQRKHEQLKQGMSEQKECDLSSAQASGLISHQLSSALSQPHAAGTQPALSHGPGAQRREVHGSQREEEVGPDWKEGGVEGDREEVSNRETTNSRKSSETADIEEEQGSEEKGAKGRKKRRKKRGKRGGAEAKLSSSSSVESQSQIEIKTTLNTQSEAKDITGRADVQSPTQREEADKDAMHLPSQTEGQTRGAHGPDRDVTNSDPSDIPEFSPTDRRRTDLTEVPASTKESPEDDSMNFHGPDHFNPDSTVTASERSQSHIRKADTEEMTSELELKGLDSPVQQTVDNVESKTWSEKEGLTVAGKAVTFVDWTALVDSDCPEELPVKLSDPTEFTEDSYLVEFPEQNTQHVQSVESNKPVQPVDPMGTPEGFMESARPTEAFGLPLEGAADVLPLQIREGSAETTAREYLEHCLASEMLRDQRHKEEKRNELWGGEEEAGKGRSRSEENDSGMVHGEELSSIQEDYDQELVATAVAVVTVAVASAMATIELSQRLADNQSESRDDLPNNDQLMSKDNCQLFPAETEHPPAEHPLIEPTDRFTSKEQANVKIRGEPDSVVLQCNTETELLPAAQQSSNQQAKLDLSALASSPRLDREETTQDKVFPCSLPEEEEEDHLAQVNMTPLPEANEMIPDSQGDVQIDLPCPVTEPGQRPEASEENPRPGEHTGPQDESICQEESDGDHSHPLESITAEGEAGRQAREQDSPHGSKSCEKALRETSHSDCQAAEHGRDPQLDVEVGTPREGEIPTLPLTCSSTLPVTPCDSTPVADPSPEEPTAPVNVETGDYQSLPDIKLLPAGSSTLQSEGDESVALDKEVGVFDGLDKDSNTLDTVEGWKEREEDKREWEEEAGEEMVTVEVTSLTAAAAAEEEECQQTRRDSDGTHTLQIQRERDVFCPETNTVTTCTDVHPDREDCVSVCVLHRDKDGVKVSAQLDDSVFKKPKDPPPYVGRRDRGVRVSCSSTDNALTQEALSPSEGALSVGTPDAVAPRSSRLSWKSETEDRGGGGGGGGEEEEKKDQLSENPVSSAILRASIRPLSPFRRHSWEPGRNSTAADNDIAQRSSLKSLSGEVKRAKPPLHRRSMSWCPSNLRRPDQEQIDNRSYSLEGLEVERAGVQAQCPSLSDQEGRTSLRTLRLDSQERGSLVSLTEEEQEGDGSSIDSQTSHQVLSVTNSCPTMFHHQILTKSISMVAISHRDIDVSGFPRSKRRISFSLSISPLLPKNRRFFSIGSPSSDDEEEEEGGRVSSFSSNSGSLEYSISEEEPGPLRSDTEGKGGPKISRTFSYLRSKMSKKGKEKEKEKKGEKDRDSKEREKKSTNGHLFIPVSPSPSTSCQHCTKLLHNKETFLCNNCGASVHKCCRESLSVCTKSRTKQQTLVPEALPGSAVNLRSKSTSSASSVSSTSSSSSRERWSTATTPDDQIPVIFPRRHPSIFSTHSNLAKSISTSNIAGLDDVPLKGLKFLSQSTDSLHQGSKVNASTESLTDEGTEMMDSQLMGEFECDMKDLEADSWSGTVDKKFLKTLKKDEIKKQDVIYELYQTEFHHARTLKIMSEVYYKGLQKELQLDTHTLDKIFPVLDDLLDTHTHFLTLLLERKRASSTEGQNNNSFLICSIGDVLLNQFSGCSADRMKKVYGKFCSRHNEAVNLYKDLHAKDKRFQAFIKRTMSSSIVRRLSIPECILLVTQRITKYPGLIQRILQHTKDCDEDHGCVCEALRCVKELITAVDSKVNEQEKKQRLREVYSRTDSKSIMRMKSGQMFAKEDLIRGRKLLHDGALQLKNSAGRLKDVQAMLLSDVLVFLQEKDQKYVFASLDQRSTVISLQNLIVREVANEERGLFLITAGIERPEMVEVLASSKEERNTWRAIIQDAMHCMEKDEDEGVPSETEEDRRQQENRAKEIRELLRRKDEQIISLLEEKVHIFRELGDCNPAPDDTNPPVRERMLFMATPDDVTKGEPIIKDALREVENLHGLVNSGVGGAGCSVPVGLTGGGVGPVCLPRRAETFGGFDSHQMNSSKNGDKEEGDESLDLRRTESDSVLKKGATASLQMLLKRNNEQVQHSVTHLHELLISLQAVVVQQDSFIEDQRQTVNDRLTANSSRHSSTSSLSSSSSSRPSSLIEQEKHRSLERQRQEAATLQKQQAAHQEEKRRREKAWELKEKCLVEREERLRLEEEQTKKRRREMTEEGEMLQRKKEEYQGELERLKEAQRRLERDKEALRRDTERLEAMERDESERLQRDQRTPSTTSEDSIRFHSTWSLDLDSKEAAEQPKEVELSTSAPTKEPFLRIGSKRMGKNFNPFSSSSSSKTQGAEKESQLPTRLLQLTKNKEKKDKRKKKGKGEPTQTESKVAVMSDPQNDGDIFFC